MERLDRTVEKLYVRQTSTILAFALLTLLSASYFSPQYTSSSLNKPYSALSTRSTIGQPGVTSPTSTQTSQEGAKATSMNITASKGGTSADVFTSLMAPKPAWTHMPLYTDPTNEATTYVSSNPTATGASYITRMGQIPVAEWFGDWNVNVSADVNSYVSAAATQRAVPVLVLYNIPERDCGGYSTGGATSAAAYTNWVQQVASSIGDRTAVIILEPDALGDLDCLSSSDQQARLQAMARAVTILKAQPATSVYIDAGNPVWQSTTTMATRLRAANIAAADGFSLNVSYFISTSQNQAYGDQLSRLVGNKHYVIDTSRNGGSQSVTGTVCNPSYAAFGANPTTNTSDALNDALLWIKIPWESDGPCNGSPAPGVVFWSYAIQLAKNAGW